MYKNYNYKTLIFSFVPFIIWLIPPLSGNASISLNTILFGFIFITLCFSTAHNHKYARIIALITLSIIIYVLYQEGLSNDMFGKIYPIFLLIFSLYYLILNFYSLRRIKQVTNLIQCIDYKYKHFIIISIHNIAQHCSFF